MTAAPHTKAKLPPPRTEPLPPGDPALARLKHVAEAAGASVEGPVFFAAAGRTRIDTGSWLIKRRVRVAVTEDELLLVAPGPMPYVERVPLAQLGESTYNHVTGEVALGPAETRVGAVRLDPLEGYQLLAQIHSED